MNGIYLYLLLREIGDELVGKHVENIETRDRVVRLLLNDRFLYISLYPKALGLFLSEKKLHEYETVRYMTDIVKSSRISSIEQHNMMPVVSVTLQKPFPKQQEMEIVLSFYPEAPNFSLKTGPRKINLFSRYVEKNAKASILKLTADEIENKNKEKLVTSIEGIDNRMAQELNSKRLNELKTILRGKQTKPKLVSVEPLHISLFAHGYIREYVSFNALLENAITDFFRAQERKSVEQQRRRASRNIRKRIARLEKKLMRTEEIEHVRKLGEMILANINIVKKGASVVKVIDPYTQKYTEIELDPHLTPQGNAQRYFTKYKKAKRGQPRLKEQIKALTEELKTLESKFEVKHVVEKKKAGTIPLKVPFIKFDLDSGSVVFAVKSARSNDELTFKYARPSDYFFHTRGFEGAHIILRPNIPRGQRPSKEEIRIAAGVAAYFSKAKKQKNVAVSYTQRKYLKKSKKGKVGSVILMREEVVFVDPKLPD